MNFQNEFRQRELVLSLAGRVKRLAAQAPRAVTIMEVCGTHTMAIHQHGLKILLPPQVRLVSGPGCPVCVTPIGYIDQALALGRLPHTIIATFGDMVRVPGSSSSLMDERARGGQIRIIYSPLDAVAMAARNPDKNIILLGIGFETTAPAVAAALLTARAENLRNFFVLSAHKTMPRAMELLAADSLAAIDGYICPAHVSTIIGAAAYEQLAAHYRKPCVVTGFEPGDILQGIEMILRQLLSDAPRVEIQYRRAVNLEGNQKALSLMNEVFFPVDAEWRGLGLIPASGLSLRGEFANFDAAQVFGIRAEASMAPPDCRCGNILRGITSPEECPLFAAACTPETPVGACMVGGEGACAAAYFYRSGHFSAISA